MSKNYDQFEVRAQAEALEKACGVIVQALSQRGDSIPIAPDLKSGDDLGNYVAMANYHGQLAFLLAKSPAPGSPASRSNVQGQTPAPASTSTPTAVPALTSDEIAGLTWAE